MSTPIIVYVITHSRRGEEEADLLSVHASLAGAKAALIEWAYDKWDEEGIEDYLKDYLCESGDCLTTEEDALFIVEQIVLP